MKPDVSLSQLSGLNASPGMLGELLEGHQELVQTFLHTGQRLGAAATDAAGAGAVGVGLTEEVVNGKRTGRPALLMQVDKLPAGGRGGAKRPGLPSRTGRGAPIVVEEVGRIRPLGYHSMYRPVPGGVSIAPSREDYAGTLGCLVRCKDATYLLSANHVLTSMNALPAGTPISQQAKMDGGLFPRNVIGSLAFWVPIVIGGVSKADAAIASIAPETEVDPRILRDNEVLEQMVAPTIRPAISMAVQKSGRSTGWTRAAVAAVGMTYVVDFPLGRSTFNNAFVVGRASGFFSASGDSGAVVTTDPANQPVGLVVHGDSVGKNTYCNGMSEVLDALAFVTGAPVTLAY